MKEIIFSEDGNWIYKIPQLKNRTEEHENICKCTNEFISKGGVVKILPDQLIPPGQQVARYYGIYESMDNLFPWKPIRVVKQGERK